MKLMGDLPLRVATACLLSTEHTMNLHMTKEQALCPDLTTRSNLPVDSMAPSFAVGFRQRVLRFQRSPLPVNLWYPTVAPGRTVLFGPYPMRVNLDAPPVLGRGRLLVISHGSKGNHLGHRDTALHLAALGYTVLAPLHPHDNYLDDSQSGTSTVWRDRPLHISQAVESVLSDPHFKDLLSHEDLGLIGFSLGGYTALRLLGAIADPHVLMAHCRAFPEDALPVSPGGPVCDLEALQSMLNEQPGPFDSVHDTRFKAAVLLAPMCALFDDAALRCVQVPISLYCAENDNVLREPHHSTRLAASVQQLAQFSTVPAAGHFSFLCPFPGALQRELPALALDDEGFDRVEFHSRLNRETGSFFNKYLR